ncbi:MAG: IclR family transcriptional regulator [Paeniglutamicibacter sp.]
MVVSLPQVPVSMVDRIGVILETFNVDDPVLTGSEIARRTGLPKATVARILVDLDRHDFVAHTESGYQIGMKCFELGERAQQPKNLRRLALATMSDLRQATGLTVQLGVLDGLDVVYIEILRGKHRELRIPSRIGGRVPSYATAGGKALLAHSAAEVQELVLSSALTKIGPRTIVDPKELAAQLERTRRDGIAYEVEESHGGLSCAASPILRSDGTALAVISITAPVGSVDMRIVGPAVHAATLGLNRQVRATPYWASL